MARLGRIEKRQHNQPAKNARSLPEHRVAQLVPFDRSDYLVSAGLALASFCVYLFTMSRSVPPIDGGELTTVLWTYGIAHPTGYPLFSLLGGLFVHIPLTSEVAVRANLFANLCTSLACGTFYLAFVSALNVFPPTSPDRERDRTKVAPGDKAYRTMRLPRTAASLTAALALAFSRTFWDQSNSVEVYPLQLLLFGLVILSWTRFYSAPSRRKAFISGLALGIGFTNHMTTVLTVPALLFLVYLTYRDRLFDKSLILPVIYGGLIASALYLYLPLRASQSPLMNWGDPETVKRFIWHVSGKQFRVWMFSSTDVFQKQLGVFFTSIYPEFRLTLILILVGIIVSLRLYRRLFWFCVLLLAGDILYAANYNIHDIASYFLLAYVALALFAAVGVKWAVEQVARLNVGYLFVFACLAIFPLFAAYSNFADVDESKDYSVEKYTRDILTNLPQNAVVLSFQWDNFVSASIYYQYVDRIRPDVTVIDKELLRRSWYAADVHTRFASLFPTYDPAYDSYRENLRLFENELPYDAAAIERSYSNFIREVISGGLNSGRRVFVGPEMEDQYLYGYKKVPFGLLFELRTDTVYVPFKSGGLDGFLASKTVETDYSKQILGFYTRMFYMRAVYEFAHSNIPETRSWLDKTLEVDPSFQSAVAAEQQLSQRQYGK